jgi:hypothetical protein
VPIYLLESSNDVLEAKVLVVLLMEGVGAGSLAAAPRVLGRVEAQLEVLGQRERPRIHRQRHHGRHLFAHDAPAPRQDRVSFHRDLVLQLLQRHLIGY